jgi:hypothetical protein
MSTTDNASARPSASFRFLIGLNDRHGRAVDRSALARAFAHLDRRFPCYTRTDAVGVWRGSTEPTVVVEVIQPDTDTNRDRARDEARALATALDQECVGLAILPLAAFILAPPFPRTLNPGSVS